MARHLLSRERYAAARQFIATTSRPLEVARFGQHFLDAPAEAVFAALRSFQNPDGGFGHALEPDLRTDDSSALCTSVALQILRATKPLDDLDMMAAAHSYLLRTLDRAESHWRIIPRSAEASPHAPWWNQTGREEAFDPFSINPTAEILGYLYDAPQQAPGGTLQDVSKRVIDHLAGLEEILMHDVLCCLRLLQSEHLPEGMRKTIHEALSPHIESAVERDPAKWNTYRMRPLQVVEDPASPFMAGLEEAVEANLDYEISSQNKDGSWTPTWTWGDACPDTWKIACREWSGILTLEKLMLLWNFGRIEGVTAA